MKRYVLIGLMLLLSAGPTFSQEWRGYLDNAVFEISEAQTNRYRHDILLVANQLHAADASDDFIIFTNTNNAQSAYDSLTAIGSLTSHNDLRHGVEKLLIAADYFRDHKMPALAEHFYSYALFHTSINIDQPLYYYVGLSLIQVRTNLYNIDTVLQHYYSLERHFSSMKRSAPLQYTEWKLVLTQLYQQQNKTQDEVMVTEDLQQYATALPATSLARVQVLARLGDFYFQQNRNSLAIKHYKQALACLAKHPAVTTTDDHFLQLTSNLSRVYYTQDCIRKSNRYYNKIVSAYTSSTHPTSLLKLGALQMSLDKFNDAITTYEGLLSQLADLEDERDKTFITVLVTLAEAYLEREQYHRAYVYLRWADELLHDATVDDTLKLAVCKHLAEVYSYKGDFDAAYELRAKAVSLSIRSQE